MNSMQKKMSKISDELFSFLLKVGATHINMDIQKKTEGYFLTIKSDFLPENRSHVEKIRKFLNPEEHDEGMEEVFWQIAGLGCSGNDSEMHLVGQMLDSASVDISDDNHVTLKLFKKRVI